MRKVLLASTALVALSSVSAMAADVTLSGSYAWVYSTDSEQTTDENSTTSEADVNIKFSNTTDSGITTTLAYGLDEGTDNANTDDINATLSGDFGTIYMDSQGDSTAIGGFDERSDKAGEGTGAGSNGIMGGGANTIGYKLPAVMDGLTIAVNVGEGASEYFGYAIAYDAGMFGIGYVQEANHTSENTYAGVSVSMGDISFGLDTVTFDSDTNANDRETINMGVGYSMGDITLGYEMGSQDDGSGVEVVSYDQIQASYAVASGITAVVTSSEVDNASGTDVSQLQMQLKLSF